VATGEHLDAARAVREALAVYRQNEDLISIGAYTGGDPAIDAARQMHEPIGRFLRQAVEEPSNVAEARRLVEELAAQCASLRKPPPTPAKIQSAS
jgi:flagellum-specific ATP synthase